MVDDGFEDTGVPIGQSDEDFDSLPQSPSDGDTGSVVERDHDMSDGDVAPFLRTTGLGNSTGSLDDGDMGHITPADSEDDEDLQAAVDASQADAAPAFGPYVVYREHESKPVRYDVLADLDPAVTKIAQVKKHLAASWNVPVAVQVLTTSDGRTLRDDETLAEAGITETGSFLTLGSIRSFTVSVEEDQAEEQKRQLGDTHKKIRALLGADSDSEFETTSGYYRSQTVIGCGLKNQGATCYLNSLVQSLFMTPQFRRMIYRYPSDFATLMAPKKKAKGRDSKGDAKDSKKPVQLSASGTIVPGDGGSDNEEGDEKALLPEKNAIYQFQCLFARMQYCSVRSVSTNGLTRSFGWENNEVFVQQDVQELNRVLIDKLEEKMKSVMPEESTEFTLRKLYRGETVNTTKCLTCERLRGRSEAFYDMTLPIKGLESIYDSFKQITEKEIMDNDNCVNCSRCNSKEPAERGMSFKSLPDVLSLHLMRFEYDWERDMRVKIDDEIDFPDTLDLSDYLADNTEFDNSDDESEPAEPEYAEGKRPVFELFAALVHSGNAGYGHYYSYIKSFENGKWYKYNDEAVTESSADEVRGKARTNYNYGSSYSSRYASSSMYRSSASPYMLIYRRVPEATEGAAKVAVDARDSPNNPMGSESASDADDSDAEGGVDVGGGDDEPMEVAPQAAVPDANGVLSDGSTFTIGPIDHNEIPAPILDKLKYEAEVRKQRADIQAREQATVAVQIYRNRLDLPEKKVRVDRNATLRQVMDALLPLVEGESEKQLHYRFRRIARRKNNTKRPMEVYSPEDLDRTLVDLGIDRKPDLYLEQHEDETFPGLDSHDKSHVFIQIRLWDETHPTTVGDFVLPDATTVRELQDIAAKEIGMRADEMVMVEEETEDLINKFGDQDKTLKDLGIITGDVIHVEPFDRDFHLDDTGALVNSLVEDYFQDIHNRIVCDVQEIKESVRERIKRDKEQAELDKELGELSMVDSAQVSTLDGLSWFDKGGSDSAYALRIETNKTHSLHNLRVVLARALQMENPYFLRIYAREAYKRYDDGKLLKQEHSQLGALLKKRTSRDLLTNLRIHILNHEEHLRRGDKLIRTKLYTGTKTFHSLPVIQINKNSTLFELKQAMSKHTGVSADRVVLSEWYQEYFYRTFPDDRKLVKDSRIRKNEVIRADELTSPELNIGKNYGTGSRLPVQVVTFMGWTEGYNGRKEVQTDYPYLATYDNDGSLFDFRMSVAERCGIPWWNIQIGLTGTFPVQESYLEVLRSWTHRFVGDEEKTRMDELYEFFNSRKRARRAKLAKEAAAKAPPKEVGKKYVPENAENQSPDEEAAGGGDDEDTEEVEDEFDEFEDDRFGFAFDGDEDPAWDDELQKWEDQAENDIEKGIFRAYRENRNHAVFDFRAESSVQIKDLRLRDLFIVVWEDLRTQKEDVGDGPELRTTGRGAARAQEVGVTISI